MAFVFIDLTHSSPGDSDLEIVWSLESTDEQIVIIYKTTCVPPDEVVTKRAVWITSRILSFHCLISADVSLLLKYDGFCYEVWNIYI